MKYIVNIVHRSERTITEKKESSFSSGVTLFLAAARQFKDDTISLSYLSSKNTFSLLLAYRYNGITTFTAICSIIKDEIWEEELKKL